MKSEYRCPQCKSPRVTLINGTALCLECGANEQIDDNYDNYKEIPEPGIILPNPEPEWSQKQWTYVQSLRAQIVHLQNKVNDLLDKKNEYLYDKIA